MLQIRNSVFETNSSSVHSLTMCSQEEYTKWENGEVLYNYGNFVTREDAVKNIEEYRKKWDPEHIGDPIDEAVLADHEYCTADYFWDNYCEYYESFEKSFTTPSGETVIAFGYFGSDY